MSSTRCRTLSIDCVVWAAMPIRGCSSSFSTSSSSNTTSKASRSSVQPLLELDGRDLGRTVGHGRKLRRGGMNAAKLFVIDELRDGGMGAAHRAIGILSQLQLAKLHAKGIEDQESADERLTDSQNQLDRLHRLDGADDAR